MLDTSALQRYGEKSATCATLKLARRRNDSGASENGSLVAAVMLDYERVHLAEIAGEDLGAVIEDGEHVGLPFIPGPANDKLPRPNRLFLRRCVRLTKHAGRCERFMFHCHL